MVYQMSGQFTFRPLKALPGMRLDRLGVDESLRVFQSGSFADSLDRSLVSRFKKLDFCPNLIADRACHMNGYSFTCTPESRENTSASELVI
jgi:hypothetical protein